MIAPKVATKQEVENVLRERDFDPTTLTTATGRFWRHKVTSRHVLVPDSIDGYYPDWLLYDLMSHIGEILPSGPISILPNAPMTDQPLVKH